MVSIESTTGLRRIGTFEGRIRVISSTTQANGGIEIQEQYQVALAALDDIKVQAVNASKDITPCLEGQEDTLNTLPTEYTLQLATCIMDPLRHVDVIVRDAADVVNGTIPTVLLIGNELERCGLNLLCVSALQADMTLQLTRLPRLIQDEVLDTEELVGNAEVIMQTCAVSNVLRMTTSSARVIREIRNCANAIINGY